MRAGGYTIQHTLTPEAATVVKQALGLARRRGHAQVTPLHVASAMLASPTSLLRKACLQPNSHPLQCKALELCFNVALNPKVQDEDVMSVIEMMMNKKRKNIVVIRECLASADAIVRGVIDKFETENNVNLRFMQFVSLPLHSLNHLSREDVEDKVRELKCLVKSYVGRGVILYLGDLKWVSDYWSNHSEQKLIRSCYYSPMEHMIMELSGLMFGVDSGKLWLMGIANSQTYMRCKTGHPSLETLWDLCPLTLSVASLDLTLNLESNKDSGNKMKMLTCCGECSVNFTREARTITSYGRTNRSITTATTTGSTLPSWLQHSLHKQPMWPVIFESNRSPKEYQFFTSIVDDECFDEPNPKTLMPELLSNPNSSPNSASCSEASEDDDHQYYLHKFKEVTSENEKVLSNALERVVPWQREVIPEIVSTILQCRSGSTMERKGKEETWLSFLGADNHGKGKIARELAKVVFGSRNNLVHIGLSSFSATRADSTDDDQEFVSNKRVRDENGQSYLETFAEAVQENASRVFLMEDIEQVDYHSQTGIKKAIQNGRITLNGGQPVLLDDAIVIFSCESFSSVSRVCSPSIRRKYNNEQRETVDESITLDLNVATEDHSRSNDQNSVSDIGILDSVDKQVIFKLQML
ncbi:Clp, N-terminal [Cynara cardunculus var. scolymus]|uniref:Clp, N-terminal n=1 Tax=Cynara cardunculus var. scolymus TaxID=59895 RepID=A0A103YE70_CYNCS|nr:Clp, N-terminal [Cynara cardunculus var. scolymus]